MTANDGSMDPDWIFIVWSNPHLCWSLIGVFSPAGPQSRQPGLSQGPFSPSGDISRLPLGFTVTPLTPTHTYATTLSNLSPPVMASFNRCTTQWIYRCDYLFVPELRVICVLITICLFIMCNLLTLIEKWNKLIIDWRTWILIAVAWMYISVRFILVCFMGGNIWSRRSSCSQYDVIRQIPCVLNSWLTLHLIKRFGSAATCH